MPVGPKFAVVREDPALEETLALRTSARRLLTVASGGCTALTLSSRRPELAVTAFDREPRQLAHVEAKLRAARAGDLRALNVRDDAPRGLNQCGEFEALFRVLRTFLEEFVCEPEERERFFASPADAPAIRARWFAHRYWSVAFEVALHERLLHAMFGPTATQHAEPGSYPRYFQRAFERGLGRADASENPFLQHVLLGSYREPPAYVGLPDGRTPQLVLGTLLDVPELEAYDVISLSNVFDWCDDATTTAWARHLAHHAKPGAHVLLRQLNNERDLRHHFEDAFAFDDVLGRELLERDRSLFYNRIEVGVRR